MTHAFGYLRVSGRGQLDGDGFTRQRECIERFAAQHDIKITQWFEEQGLSGENELDDRAALQELLASLYFNGIRLILIEKLDRLARKLTVQESIIADFQKSGFTLVSVMEPDLCSDDPSRVLLRQFMGAIAEYDKKMIVARLKAARQRIRNKTGRCEGRKPYGTREGESAAIGRIRGLHATGRTYTEIAQTMNDEKYSTRNGGQWYVASVSRVLQRASVPCIDATALVS
jgi:DNA invertase Pin-like site-specific DNA recombinase